MRTFLGELRRRNVLRVTAAYLIAAWVIVQVADVLLPTFDAPPATLKVITILLALVLPVVIAAAWTFEWTPAGLIRDAGEIVDRTFRIKARRKLDYVILVLSLVLVAIIGGTRNWSNDIPLGSAKSVPLVLDRQSIAVLPFTNITGRDEDFPLADGIAESLIHQFGQVKGLRVTARSSSFVFREEKADARIIGERLGVSSMLDGSIQRSGDRLRIIAQLVDTNSGTQLWTAQFDRTVSDIFDMQDEISRSVTDALRVNLLTTETGSGNPQFVPEIEAYQAYLIGRREYARDNQEAASSAAVNFERAVALSPAYALAYAGLGETYLLLEYMLVAEPGHMLAKAAVSIQRALELDPLLGEAHAALGELNLYEGNDALAVAAFERAIELNPSYARAYELYSNYLYDSNVARSAEMLQRAYELDPLSRQINMDLSWRAVMSGDFDAAIKHSKISMETEPSHTVSYVAIGRIVGKNHGRLDEAARWFHAAEATYVGTWATEALVGAYIDMLDTAAAENAILAAGPDRLADPVFMYMARMRLSNARGDDDVTAEMANKIFAEVREGFPWFEPTFDARRNLAFILVRNGQCPRAIELYADELANYAAGGISEIVVTWKPLQEIPDLGHVLFRCDRGVLAQTMLTEFVDHLRANANTYGFMQVGELAFCESAALALLQREDDAIEALQRAVTYGYRLGWSVLLDSHQDPRFDSVRGDPRFLALVDRLTQEAHEMRSSFENDPGISRSGFGGRSPMVRIEWPLSEE